MEASCIQNASKRKKKYTSISFVTGVGLNCLSEQTHQCSFCRFYSTSPCNEMYKIYTSTVEIQSFRRNGRIKIHDNINKQQAVSLLDTKVQEVYLFICSFVSFRASLCIEFGGSDIFHAL